MRRRERRIEAPGAPVITWSCWGGANQQWFPSATGTRYNLINQNSGLCMDVSGQSQSPGGPVIQWTCNGGANQAFSLTPQGAGYAIVAGHSGLCVTASSTTSQGNQLSQQVCNGSATQTWQVAGLPVQQAALPSKWTTPYQLPLVPLQAANLPNGNVLVWSADAPLDFTDSANPPARTYTAIFNPSNGTSSQVIVTNTAHDMFCPGISNLPDGRIFVTGGLSVRQTSIYSPTTNTWTAGNQMNIPRGYQGSVTLSNGNVFVMGGSWAEGSEESPAKRGPRVRAGGSIARFSTITSSRTTREACSAPTITRGCSRSATDACSMRDRARRCTGSIRRATAT